MNLVANEATPGCHGFSHFVALLLLLISLTYPLLAIKVKYEQVLVDKVDK